MSKVVVVAVVAAAGVAVSVLRRRKARSGAAVWREATADPVH